MGFGVHDPQPIQIQGDLVGILLCSGHTSPSVIEWEIVVWNWKTGDLVFRKHGVSRGISFTFASANSYILAERHGSSAHLFIDYLDTRSEVAAPRLKLRLPELCAGWTYGPLNFRSDLPSARDSNQSGQAFLPDPETGVICLSVGLSGPRSANDSRDEHMPHLGLFVGREAVRRRVLQPNASSREPLELSWDQWGEDVARWIDMGKMPGLLPAVHGSRYVQLVRQEHSSRAWLQVLDFSPAAVYSNIAPANNDTSESRHSDPTRIREASTSYEQLNVILANANRRAPAGSVLVEKFGYDRPTVLDIPGAFLHRVVSRLPYRCTTRVEPTHAGSEWTIDGDLLLEVKVRTPG
ncbi:hypothetical protein FRC06_004615 [Ceratobasidium sp. 370]|nr:hypothetical protein FRC06_004615 [Ceratobasidium sp. 370]